MNTQPHATVRHDLDTVEIHSIFYTIQGEGPFNGRCAVFVRLTGCNLQCPGCDTEYTAVRQRMTHSEVLEVVADKYVAANFSNLLPLVVITGGEPFRQLALGNLVRFFAGNGFDVQIETNGSVPPRDADFPWHLCTIVCSPKTPGINSIMARRANFFKYVLTAGRLDVDGLPTDVLDNGHTHIAKPPANFPRENIFVQPAEAISETETPDPACVLVNHRNLQATVESALKHGYRLCLQVHKLANLP